MLALCGNCHPALARLGRDIQYEAKQAPHNIRTGRLCGALEFDKRDLVFKVGGNWFENTPTILQFCNMPIVSCYVADGQAKVSLNLFDQAGRSMLTVADNNVSFRIDNVWDFEYGHNFATARYGPRDIALRIDLRKPEAVIEGKVWLGSQQIRLGPNETSLWGVNKIGGARISGCRVGLQFGDPSRDISSGHANSFSITAA